MPPRRTRQERSDERQRAILTAATEILVGERMSAVTHRNVAARAGVPGGAIRYYFSTREDLLSAVLADLDRARRDAAREAATVPAGAAPGTAELVDRLVRSGLGAPLDDDTLRGVVGSLADAARESPRLARELAEQWAGTEHDVAATLRACGRPERSARRYLLLMDGALLAAAVQGRTGLAGFVADELAAALDGE
ncbi:TetR/AcrR family transcriptional regulator [Pseudonocardia sp. TMWB2A]|uniref:TetR/AcrR family transcriptional regulator n=1 Tax=unclassified Pseudonocardia TaxID=2619320 RepID=UPI001CF6CD5C|nr:TetR family transcriptional regulator [Pseudonocardia sp. ICBG162]